MEAICPIIMNGYSTGCLPIQVSTMNVAISIQNIIWERGRKADESFFDVCRKGIRNQTRIEASRAITPPNFLGIDRRIAYANKKYHSGWICGGVTSGLAGIKFSGSFNAPGNKNAKVNNIEIKAIKPTVSLVV